MRTSKRIRGSTQPSRSTGEGVPIQSIPGHALYVAASSAMHIKPHTPVAAKILKNLLVLTSW